MNTANIFGVPIEGWSYPDIVSAADRKILRPFWIVTANPEILLEAKRNREYAQTIKRADVHTVDGFGLWLILRLFGARTHRVTGVELSEYLLHVAKSRQWKIALLGGKEGVAQKALEEIRVVYPELELMAEAGGQIQPDGTEDDRTRSARERIAAFHPDILLVAFGHPKQEMWISRHLSHFQGHPIVIGVGGTFDFWAGVQKRAPRAMRAMGLEWLWRLFREPKRILRIWNAVVVFPIAAIGNLKENK